MLSTGIRTPVGLKVSGADLATIEEIGTQIEAALPAVRGTRNVFAERTGGGFFLDVEWNREELARYGLSIDEAQAVVQNAIGGENVTTTVEGRERYPVNVRYMRDFRSDFDALGRVLVPASEGQRQIPLRQLADIKVASGPAMIRNEDGLLTGYVFVDVDGRDLDSYVEEADALIRQKVKLPAGYAALWSGQYEAMQRVRQRLTYVIPLTLFLMLLLLYFNTRSMVKTAIVALAVPFSAIGAVWFLYLLGYNMSIAVWVGLIALLGVDAETGVFMLLYLDLSYEDARKKGRLHLARRAPGSDRARRRQAAAPEVHDGRDHLHRVPADHVGHRDGIGRDEADRRADDRRHLHVVPPRAGRLPGHLRDLEVALRGKEAGRRRDGDGPVILRTMHMTTRWVLTLAMTVVPAVALAQGGAAELKTDKEKLSYAMGMDLGGQLKTRSVEVDPAVFAQGLKDALSGGKTLLTDDEAKKVITELQKVMVARNMAEMQAAGEKNQAAGEAFLAANKAKEGVVTLPSGLQYKIITAGTGPKPTLEQTVVCHYRGTLIDGTEFDSSYKRGQPATFPVKGVIKGWTDVLQLMPAGSKWQVFIPGSLAYGMRGSGPTIGPNATLVFEIELVSIR